MKDKEHTVTSIWYLQKRRLYRRCNDQYQSSFEEYSLVAVPVKDEIRKKKMCDVSGRQKAITSIPTLRLVSHSNVVGKDGDDSASLREGSMHGSFLLDVADGQQQAVSPAFELRRQQLFENSVHHHRLMQSMTAWLLLSPS